ncbi:ABC-2 type transport system ATP-binding protein [Arthrobacter sp. GAS37]|uniref:ABC transporter ATP-binding protein n=1 Tax=Arthrobacter sp. GAS37 TaxID=3156261 RepID=UPI003833EA9A
MSVDAILVSDLLRTFGTGGSRRTALDGVSFSVAEGEAVAILGANGAGKTTLTKILSTLLLPSGGRAQIFGHDVQSDSLAVRRLSSTILGGDRGLYNRLTGRQNLRFFGAIDGLPTAAAKSAIPAMLDTVGLTEHADRRVETYSKGMRQRLHIAIGLLKSPRLLLLDEPTVGLDPTEARRLRESIRAMNESGVTVLLTSHHLLDVESLATRVIMLEAGRIVADLPTKHFASLAGYEAIVELALKRPLDRANSLRHVQVHPRNPLRANVTVSSWNASTFEDLAYELNLIDPERVTVRSSTLDDAFAALERRENK